MGSMFSSLFEKITVPNKIKENHPKTKNDKLILKNNDEYPSLYFRAIRD